MVIQKREKTLMCVSSSPLAAILNEVDAVIMASLYCGDGDGGGGGGVYHRSLTKKLVWRYRQRSKEEDLRV